MRRVHVGGVVLGREADANGQALRDLAQDELFRPGEDLVEGLDGGSGSRVQEPVQRFEVHRVGLAPPQSPSRSQGGALEPGKPVDVESLQLLLPLEQGLEEQLFAQRRVHPGQHLGLREQELDEPHAAGTTTLLFEAQHRRHVRRVHPLVSAKQDLRHRPSLEQRLETTELEPQSVEALLRAVVRHGVTEQGIVQDRPQEPAVGETGEHRLVHLGHPHLVVVGSERPPGVGAGPYRVDVGIVSRGRAHPEAAVAGEAGLGQTTEEDQSQSEDCPTGTASPELHSRALRAGTAPGEKLVLLLR